MISKRFLKGDVAKVTFAVNVEGDVEGVSLLCESVDWQPIPMDESKQGEWRVAVRLPANQEIQFRYLASGGNWLNDTAADSYVRNGYGSDNSVVDTRRP